MREWFALTFLMGSFFIGGQIYEYAALVSEGQITQKQADSYNDYYAKHGGESRSVAN